MTTSITQAHRKISYIGNHKLVMIKMTLISGDTVATVRTGLKKIYSFSVSPPEKTTKALDHSTVAGGVITVNFADPLAGASLYITAIGIG
jgi:hypothetical protein